MKYITHAASFNHSPLLSNITSDFSWKLQQNCNGSETQFKNNTASKRVHYSAAHNFTKQLPIFNILSTQTLR